MIHQIQAKIIENKQVTPRHCHMRLLAPEIAAKVRSGQFVHVRCNDTYNPLLRRPISVMRSDAAAGTFDLLYQVVGPGTTILSKLNADVALDVIGPLGNGFPDNAEKKQVMYVAGGVGAASLFSHAVISAQQHAHNARFLIGAQTKEDIVCAALLEQQGVRVDVATNDGSAGYEGYVTGLLESLAAQGDMNAIEAMYTCGPRIMMRRVARVAGEHNVACWVSMEEWMGCGVGVCYGCAVETHQGIKRACKDGPVFPAEKIIWDANNK